MAAKRVKSHSLSWPRVGTLSLSEKVAGRYGERQSVKGTRTSERNKWSKSDN